VKSVSSFVAACLVFVAMFSLPSKSSSEPLPLDVALSLRGHNARSSFAFSPDGLWIAHTVETTDAVRADTRFFSSTGIPLAEGRARMEAHLTNIRTGEELRLGGAASSSWAPVWSPDGKRVAFYSDEGGSAGLWIWTLATKRAARFPGVIVRPFFGFETPRWSADSQRVLCKILPQGWTIAKANALVPMEETGRRFPPHDPNSPGVLVLRSGAGEASPRTDGTLATTSRSLADLALLDLRTHRVRRIVRAAKVMWYSFSPDRRTIAFTELLGFLPNGQQPLYRLGTFDTVSGGRRSLTDDLAMGYGIELNWSPDGRSIASSDVDAQGSVRLSVWPVDGSPVHHLPRDPNAQLQFDAPRWSKDGRSLYLIGAGGKVWRTDAVSGADEALATPEGVEVTALVSSFDRPVAWSTGHGEFLWALGLQRDGYKRSILRINTATGKVDSDSLPSREIDSSPNVDANDATGQIAFVAKDQRHPADLWMYDTKLRQTRQISHLNPALERYELGDTRLITFRSGNGRSLQATLLLPPGFQPGQPVPTVVWVYGGERGSDALRRFGLWGDSPMFNMQILATRGYAVLFPDTPLRGATAVKDLLDTVMPAVDAAVDQGFADRDRLAIMGQSFGAYSVLALITHTNRFKAAVVTAPVISPDLLASYLEMASDGSPRWIGYLEQGQLGMGGSPWQFPSRYLENSPIYAFDKITTPVLIGEGSEDGRLLGADATFVALRRLGKDVEYRLYQGEGHALERMPDVRDFWERRLAFLAEHLPVKN
jgi:dipeptidyl aminopeptidase/acylaminoacyl peptidase